MGDVGLSLQLTIALTWFFAWAIIAALGVGWLTRKWEATDV